MSSFGKLQNEVNAGAKTGANPTTRAAIDMAFELVGVFRADRAKAIALQLAQPTRSVGPWVREPDGGAPYDREEAREFIREEFERMQQEQQASKLATATKRGPYKPVTYELACERWREYAARYEPLYGKSQKPPLRDFPVWWGNHYPADAISSTTLGKLRKNWDTATEPFPPNGENG